MLFLLADATPAKSCGPESTLKNCAWSLLYIAKIPDAISVAAALVIAVAIVGSIAVVVGGELTEIHEDEDFRSKMELARHDFNEWLEREHDMIITELQIVNTTN
eukprot:SAG31_NODE_7856_length_1582_cov_1.328388_1_plen_103_part_10